MSWWAIEGTFSDFLPHYLIADAAVWAVGLLFGIIEGVIE